MQIARRHRNVALPQGRLHHRQSGAVIDGVARVGHPCGRFLACSMAIWNSALAPEAPSMALTAMSCTCCLTSASCFSSRCLAQFSGPEVSNRTPSLADFITNTFASRFSVHTSQYPGPHLPPGVPPETALRVPGTNRTHLQSARPTKQSAHLPEREMHFASLDKGPFNRTVVAFLRSKVDSMAPAQSREALRSSIAQKLALTAWRLCHSDTGRLIRPFPRPIPVITERALLALIPGGTRRAES
jgi:hypothetical protein